MGPSPSRRCSSSSRVASGSLVHTVEWMPPLPNIEIDAPETGQQLGERRAEPHSARLAIEHAVDCADRIGHRSLAVLVSGEAAQTGAAAECGTTAARGCDTTRIASRPLGIHGESGGGTPYTQLKLPISN